MKSLVKKNKLTVIVILFALILSFVFANNALTAFAYSEENYEDAGINFLKSQYEMKGLEYNSLIVADAINLYDNGEDVIAKLLILDRDGELDYVILDFTIDKINGFGINEFDYLQNFYGKGHIYYAGQLNFAYIQDEQYFDLNGDILDKNAFLDEMQVFKLSAPAVESGFDGILSWNNILTRHSSICNSDWLYITGFYWNGLRSNSNGITASYFDQATFNLEYNRLHPGSDMRGTCGPTAMTNMVVYFQWLGFNALVGGTPYNTFIWFANNVDWFNWGNPNVKINLWQNTKNSFVNYAHNRGYSYYMTTYNNPSFNDFKTQVKNGTPIYTYLSANEKSGSSWAHAVVTVGYEQFTHTYQVNKRWWLFGWHDNWVTMQENYYYLRCIDGWPTSNSAHFVDFNNFYASVMAAAFKLA